MQRQLQRQRGMTLIGMVLVAFVAGIFVLATIRLVPVYLEYMKVDSAFKAMKADLDGSNAGPGQIRTSLERRFDIDDVRSIRARDVTIERTSNGHNVSVKYEGRAPFVANIYFVVEFDKAVEVAR